MSVSQTHLRKLTVADLSIILEWRNHPKVRYHMFTQHEISLEEHLLWFERASKDVSRHLLVYERDRNPLGFINIHEVGLGGIADWGFYAAPNAPKGTGRTLGHAALQYAFQEKGLYKLCGQVLAQNERSIRFHLGLGFQQEGVLRQQYFDGKHYYDVVCFGLLAKDRQPEV